jgi:hypothetical protein
VRLRLIWTLIVGLGLAAGLSLVQGRPVPEEILPWTGPKAEKVVFLGGVLSDEDRISLTSALAASGHPGVLLFDSPRSQRYNRVFFEEFHPQRVIPVGGFPQGKADLEERLQVKTTAIQTWPPDSPTGLWKSLFPRPGKIVVSPARPRRLLLQAACLAGALRAPLLVSHGKAEDSERVRRICKDWPIQEIVAVGDVAGRFPSNVGVTRLPDEQAVADAHLRRLLADGPVTALVVANPADGEAGGSSAPGEGKAEDNAMSSLAPWIALQKRALLLLTNADGSNIERLVDSSLRKTGVERADTLILAGDLQALPMQKRPNPLAGGKDRFIEMEPMTPAGTEPFSFSVGRLFHEDLNVVALQLARPRLWAGAGRKENRVLVVSNPGGGLPLLEAFSRTTASELANAGYGTTTLFGHGASAAAIRRLLPRQTIFLWEGHHSTLVRDYETPFWTEPLRPSLVFLQSCLALTEDKAQPFLRRGAVAVIGSSTRTYSASGGALTLAFFDALAYDGRTLGGSLRQAKNFLLAFSQLKKKRLGNDAKLTGANLRTAWAFTLWGDPTLDLPRPRPPSQGLPRIQANVGEKLIRVALPEAAHEKARTGRYEVQTWANARLGGLLRAGDEAQKLVPLVFAEVSWPEPPPGKSPRLHSRLPASNWVFCWDSRRATGYLLAVPRAKDTEELRFQVHWD